MLSLPLGIVTALSSLNVNAPRYIVDRRRHQRRRRLPRLRPERGAHIPNAVLIYGASTFASFAASLLLVPSLGLIAAGVALIISVVVSFVEAGILLERELKRAAEQS